MSRFARRAGLTPRLVDLAKLRYKVCRMPKHSVKIHDYDVHRVELRTRMPFKYGIATMVQMPQIFVRLRVEVGAKSATGISADLLPPKWFTKIPDKPLAEEIREMLEVIQHALELARGLGGDTVFDLWRELYQAQRQWSREIRQAREEVRREMREAGRELGREFRSWR